MIPRTHTLLSLDTFRLTWLTTTAYKPYTPLQRWLKALLSSLIIGLLGAAILPFATWAQSTQLYFPTVPPKKARHLNHLYEYDPSPLNGRVPLIVLPGRAQEYQRHSWWKRFYKSFTEHPGLKSTYKPYVFLYDSTQEVALLSEELHQELSVLLKAMPSSQSIVLASYSMGGLLARDALVTHPEQLDRTQAVLGISVPFHGSPMFDRQWFTHYLDHVSPIRDFWDRLAYKTYFASKENLQRRMHWANFDGSLPNYLGNKGQVKLTRPAYTLNSKPGTPDLDQAFRKRLVVHASFLDTPYTRLTNDELKAHKEPWSVRIAKAPKALIGSVLPFYGFTVHSIFDNMNLELANLPTWSPTDKAPQNSHLYRYNDGVIPLSSMLYLPERPRQPYNEDYRTLATLSNNCRVRILDDLDHTDMGHYRLTDSLLNRKDLLTDSSPRKKPLEWLMQDLAELQSTSKQLKSRAHYCQPNRLN